MKFAVIVCPHCKKAKGVDRSYKTTRCPGCDKILTIKRLKIFYETESQEKLRQAIGLVNAKVAGKCSEFRKLVIR
jgi:hypothetical protein